MLSARAAALGQLRGADLELTAGRYVCLSLETEALRALVAVLSGRERPRSGLVQVAGLPPASRPDVRQKLAALLPDEALPPARTLLSSVEKVLAARGAASSNGAALLANASLAHLAGIAPETLGQRETRSVALALALAHDAAQLFVLHEPLTTLLPAPFVLAALDRHTERGALVLTTTTSPADASQLGGRWLSLELGRVRSTETATPRLGVGPWQQVLVETDDARALSQLLHESAHELTTELGATPLSLKVSGPALDVTVQTLITLARRHDIELRRIEAAVPPVEALLAARAGFSRGAYEASRGAALAPQQLQQAGAPPHAAPPPPPPPPPEQIIQTPRTSYPPEPQ